MAPRGRKSNASLQVVTPDAAAIEAIPRQPAPDELSDEEAREWTAIVNRMAADHFGRETQALLAQYVRHVVRARKIAAMLHAMEDGEGQLDISDWDRLTKMQRRETEAIKSLSASMRLSQQSVIEPKKTKGRTAQTGNKPWES